MASRPETPSLRPCHACRDARNDARNDAGNDAVNDAGNDAVFPLQPNEIVAHARTDGSLRFGSVLRVNGDGTLEVSWRSAMVLWL